jgi:hypothetical protein
MNSIVFQEFVNTKAGEPYRLFPFGKIVKGGKVREITPEYAATIKLPHFKPAIKLGSHEDATPAGGHIIGLEVRADGLYAVPEFNDKGAAALHDGAYRYHSPEIIWEGGLEDPQGGVINAPLIVGDALLHTPHLGEATAMYSIAPILEKKQEVKVETVEKIVEPEDYTAVKTELEQYRAETARMKAEAEHKERVSKFNADLAETKADPTLAELLAGLPAESAEAVMKQFRALSEQIKESNLTGEQGTPAEASIEDPKAAFNAAVLNIVKDKKISYTEAFESAKLSHADLFKSAFKK